MAIDYPVKPGECISSIAYQFGLAPDTVWNDPKNSELQNLRKHPNTLLADVDVVHVRDLRERVESAETDVRHRFRRRGVPEELRLRFLDQKNKARAGVPYELTVKGGGIFKGVTDGNGVVKAAIAPDAASAMLFLRPAGEPEERYDLDLGHLAPPGFADGTAERLRHLGFLVDDGMIEDEEQELQIAISMFQTQQGIPVTGKADAATLEALRVFHGS